MNPDPTPKEVTDVVNNSKGVNTTNGAPVATTADTDIAVMDNATAESNTVVVSLSQTTQHDETKNNNTNQRNKQNADHLIQAQSRVSGSRKIKVNPTIVYYWLKTPIVDYTSKSTTSTFAEDIEARESYVSSKKGLFVRLRLGNA